MTPPSPPANPVKVWDPVVRLFHWSLVLMVALALVTGYLLPRPWLNQHIFGGVAAAVLVIVRLVWGFTGTFYARFAQFVASPAASLSHARELLAGHSGRHLGHNPLGAWMILALLAALAGLGLTGTLVLAGFFKAGPLAFAMSFAGGRLARNVHELLALGLGGLIVLHVAGALYESRRTRENLVRAMVTGTKLGPQAPGYRAGLARPLLTVALLAGVLVPGVWLVLAGNKLPGKGVPTAPMLAEYVTECGACHTALHPSFLPAASWAQVMSGLDKHFGENASLDAPLAASLGAWLANSSAEKFDTLPANLFRTINPAEPMRITATNGWKRMHHELDSAIFSTKPVGSRINCANCHHDAATGRLYPADIGIPVRSP